MTKIRNRGDKVSDWTGNLDSELSNSSLQMIQIQRDFFEGRGLWEVGGSAAPRWLALTD